MIRITALAALAVVVLALGLGATTYAVVEPPPPTSQVLCEVITRPVMDANGRPTLARHTAFMCINLATGSKWIVEDNWASAGETQRQNEANTTTGLWRFMHDERGNPVGHLFITQGQYDAAGGGRGCKAKCDADMEARTGGDYPNAPTPGGTTGGGYSIPGGNFCWAYTRCIEACLVDGGGVRR